MERNAPGISDVSYPRGPVHTGLKAIDALTTIRWGQSVVIIGDVGTGKTTVGVDTIINQRGGEIHCVYVAVGQERASVAAVVEALGAAGAMTRTTAIVASSDDPAGLRYLAPYAGCTVGEYFRDSGRHALSVYDDLCRHAAAWEELSRTLRRAADLTSLHARLLERTAKLSDVLGGGSLTALSIVETERGDVSHPVARNVLSLADSRIPLDAEMFAAGVRPAVKFPVPVTKYPPPDQARALRRVVPRLRVQIAQHAELVGLAPVAANLDRSTQAQLARGQRMVEVLKQAPHRPLPVERQVAIIFALVEGLLDDVRVESIRPFEAFFYRWLERRRPRILTDIREGNDLGDELAGALAQALTNAKAEFARRPATDPAPPADIS